MKTVALVGGPEALKLLARWAPDPRSAVQSALAQVWRYFDPADYAKAVLQEAPLDHGEIKITLVEHIPHLRALRHLRDVWLDLLDSEIADDLAFLRDAPATTWLSVKARGPADFSPLADCPMLELVKVPSGEVSAGLEILAGLTELKFLYIRPPAEGQDLSFLASCPALTNVALYSCAELSDGHAAVLDGSVVANPPRPEPRAAGLTAAPA